MSCIMGNMGNMGNMGKHPVAPPSVYDPVAVTPCPAFERARPSAISALPPVPMDTLVRAASMPRHVWFHPEPVRLARQDTFSRGRRGACTEPQLFPAPYVIKPTGLETPGFNFSCRAPPHGSTPLKSIFVTSAVL
jgi:hypothetical protein